MTRKIREPNPHNKDAVTAPPRMPRNVFLRPLKVPKMKRIKDVPARTEDRHYGPKRRRSDAATFRMTG